MQMNVHLEHEATMVIGALVADMASLGCLVQ